MKKTLKNVDLSLITPLILSVLLVILGILVMVFKSFGLTSIVLYVATLFYIYAFFSILLYFVKRKEGDYELLLLSLINIVVATFLFLLSKQDMPIILGAAMVIYTILIVANRGYKIITLRRQDNFMWVIKFIITFLIAFLGVLTSANLYMEKTVQTMMFGYYFMSLGFLLTIENLIEIFITEDKYKRILAKLIVEDNKLEAVKEEPKKVDTVKKASTKKETAPKTVKMAEKKETPKEVKAKPAEKATVKKVTSTTKKKTPAKTSTKVNTPKVKEEELKKKAGRPKKNN